MNRSLSQSEIDSLVDALNALKSYADENIISTDILRGQVVLTQREIDALISSLSSSTDFPSIRPNVNVSLSQAEIDSLIDALNSIKEYENSDALDDEIKGIDLNQSVLSQPQIDTLIDTLMSLKESN